MEVQALYEIANQQNIEVLPYPMKENGSMSVMLEDGTCYIGIDREKRDSSVLERVHLGHELGHCMTGSFYNIYAAIDHRQRHENRADKWAITHLIPYDDLISAANHGYTECWELAEYFGVTEDFIKKAVCYYSNGNLATEFYV